jgi:hypothetical protein
VVENATMAEKRKDKMSYLDDDFEISHRKRNKISLQSLLADEDVDMNNAVRGTPSGGFNRANTTTSDVTIEVLPSTSNGFAS